MAPPGEVVGAPLANDAVPVETTGRVVGFDVLRGIAVLLVVLFHGYSLSVSDRGSELPWLDAVNTVLLPLRMPMLMLLSGLFVPRSLAKGTRRFVVGKVRTLAWPYAVWSVIMLGIYALGSVTVGRPFSVGVFLDVFYRPLDHLWFLAYLFIYSMIALAAKRVPTLVLSVVFSLVAMIPVPGPWAVFWDLGAFFLLGAWLAAGRLDMLVARMPTRRLAVMVAVPLALVVIAALLVDPLQWRIYSAPLAAVAIVAVVVAASRAGRLRGLSGMALIGRHSVVVYLVHWPVALVLSEVISDATTLSLPWVTSTVTVLALLASFVAVWGSVKSPVVRALFVAPAPFTRAR